LVGEIVNKTIKITLVAIESSAFSKEIMNFAHFIGAPLVVLEDVDQVLEHIYYEDIGVSYGFGMKFTRSVIESFPKGILNIHTGDLPKYRSRHPVSWAMINGDNQIGVTIHKVDEAIDCGFLVHKYHIERSFLDDLNSIQAKIENALVEEFPKAIENLDKISKIKLDTGTYFQRIDKVFNQVDPEKITAKELYSLFMSQKIYGGVSVHGNKKLECHIFNKEFSSYYDGYEIYKCNDGVLVAIR